MTHGAVVVLFHPSAEQVEHALSVAALVDDLVVVENTPQRDDDLGDRLRAAGAEVLHHGNAAGLAGALNLGARHLMARGHDGFFCLDQDSTVDPGFFTAMVAGAAVLGDVASTPSIIGPAIHEEALDLRVAPLPVRDGPAEPAGTLVPTQMVITSGCLISRAAWELLGEFREEFFIESVDIEYCWRARAQGVGVFMDDAVVLRQRTGELARHGNVLATNHSPVRCHYRVRNYLHVRQRYLGLRGLPGSLRMLLQQLRAVVRFEDRKAAKVVASLVGAHDGWWGRLGPMHRTRPRLHRWCSTPRGHRARPR